MEEDVFSYSVWCHTESLSLHVCRSLHEQQMSQLLVMADNQIETCIGLGGGLLEIAKFNQYWSKGSTLLFLDLTLWPFGPWGNIQAPAPFNGSMFIVYLSTGSVRYLHLNSGGTAALALFHNVHSSIFRGGRHLFNCVVATIRGRYDNTVYLQTLWHPFSRNQPFFFYLKN